MTNHEKHILLWDKLAKTGAGPKEKDDIFGQLFPDCDPNSSAACNSCWACQEDEDKADDCTACLRCPIEWAAPTDEPLIGTRCCVKRSPFIIWSHSEDIDQRKRLAAQIRDLPWREK
jgi:hypothetical protein